MKKISAVLALTLMSTIAFAQADDYQYSNYKEMYFHDLDSGTYSFVYTCTDNTLQWNKTTKKYTRTIDKTTSKGFEMIQHNGDSIKTINNSVDSKGVKFFGEYEVTFLNENKYVRHNKTRNVEADGTEYKSERVIEGVYVDGTYNTTKITVDGVDKPIKKSTFVSVLNDNQSNDTVDAFSYEPANVKEQMQDSSIESVTLRIDTVCNNVSTKL